MESVRRNSLSQQVLDSIVSLLTSGELKPGDKLESELTLMKQFDVSRPVLREALSSLETMDIITRKPREGTFINNKVGADPFQAMLAISINNIPAIVEARMALETGLVTLAAEKITDGQLEKLKKTIHGIQENKDRDYGEYDKEFHRIIAFCANNPIVEGMISSLLLTHEKTNRLILFREPEITIEHHQAIYEALKKRDPIESFNQMYRHLTYVRDKILSGYEKQQ